LSPIKDVEILEHLRDVVLHSYLQDTDRAFVLDSEGHYSRPSPAAASLNAQHILLQYYTESSE
jgi:hypothetical protein